MKDISIKGILVGIAAHFVLSIVAGYYASIHFLEIYKELGLTIEAIEAGTAQLDSMDLLVLPDYIVLVLLLIIATTGVSSAIVV